MDVWTAISFLPYDTGFLFKFFFPRLNGRSKLDVSLARHRQPQCYLDVVDIAASGKGFRKLEEVRKTSELSAALGRLPAQHQGTIRVYVDELRDEDFQRHLSKLCKLPGQENPAAVHGTGFTTLASQWKFRNPIRWFLQSGYQFDWSTNSSSPWDIGTLEDPEHPLKNTARVFREMLGGPRRQWARTRQRIILRHGNDGRLTGATLS